MQVYWGHFFGLFRHMTNRNLFYKIKLRHFLLLSNFAQKIRKNDPILSSRVASGRTDRRSNRTNGTFSLAWVSKCFSDINVKSISHDTKFRKTVKPFFPNKDKSTNIMNNHFTNITTHLKLKPTKIDLKKNLEIIQNQESIKRIKLTIFHSKSS